MLTPTDENIYRHLKGEYAQFREIVEGLGDMVFVKDMHGHYLSVNSAFEEVLGLPREAIIGRHDSDLFTGQLVKTIREHEQQLVHTGEPVEYELSYRGDTDTRLFRSRKYLLKDDTGMPTAIVGISRDVTSERIAEARYRFIFDNAPIALWEEDFSGVKAILEGLRSSGVQDFRSHFLSHPEDLDRCVAAIRINDVNLATMRMNRTTDKPRFISQLRRRFTPESESLFLDEFCALAEGRTYFRSEASTMEVGGELLEVQFHLNVLPGHEDDLSMVLVSMIDITPLKQTQNRLSQMTELYRSVVEGQHQMICRFTPSGGISFFNSAFSSFFGRKGIDLHGAVFHDLFPGNGTDECTGMLHGLTPSSPTCVIDTHNYDERGNMVWQSWSVSALFSGPGEVEEYQAVGMDITERKDTEDRLAASEARWRSVFENAEDIIFTMNATGLILSANGPASRALGDRAAGRLLTEVLSSDTQHYAQQAVQQVFERGDRVEQELTVQQGPLAGRVLSCVFTPIYHGDRVLSATLIARDITERRRLENRVREALIEGQEVERRRVSRELHDGLGQLFTAIKLNMQHLRNGLGESPGAETMNRLDQLEHNISVAINEVKHISHDLMPDVLEQFGLNPAMHDLVKNWNTTGSVPVSLEVVDLRDDLPRPMALALFRMAQELITNAVRHSGAKSVFVQLIDHGKSIVLMVEDDGSGFSQEDDSLGLGLRNIRSRAELLGGTVDIDSSPGRGTVTTIEIPFRNEHPT